MLTLLFVLGLIWCAYWLVKLLLDWGHYISEPKVGPVCSVCSNALDTKPANMSSSVVSSASGSRSVDGGKRKTSGYKNVTKGAQKTTATSNQDLSKPTRLYDAPTQKDDLKKIKGVGVVMEGTLNDLGITTFNQLAEFTQADISKVSEVLDAANSGFGDRIERDKWVEQAKIFARKAS